MPYAVQVEIVLIGDGEFEHDHLARRQLVEFLEDGLFEQRFGLGFLPTTYVDLRLDDRHEASGDDLTGHLELLSHDVLNARVVGLFDDGAHLSAKHPLFRRSVEQWRELRHGFINWTPSFSASRPLSTFRKGTTRFTFHK